jgi:hypothetical protein
MRNDKDLVLICSKDVVSYLVKKLHPVLQLEQVGKPTGRSAKFSALHSKLKDPQAGNAVQFSLTAHS